MTTSRESSEFIDVKTLMKELSLEELCQTAEDYFRKITNYDYLLAKPFASPDEATELLIRFAQVLKGLQILPEMTILDFGAGTCWTSRYLTQLGLNVISLDVSTSALEIGKELYKRQPVIGDKPEPRFLIFNGSKIDLPNCSVDRILCFDAFHHVPNPEALLKEMARVLREGGIAGFSEPGPSHSKTPEAQYEMKNFRVVENDVNIREIWEAAREAGFTKIDLGVFNTALFCLSLNEFEEYLNGGNVNRRYAETTRSFMQHNRLFFLHKGDSPLPDSRQRTGLFAQLNVETLSAKVKAGTPFHFQVAVTNTGSAIWLPATAKVGAVNLGIHLLTRSGEILDYDYFRYRLSSRQDKPIMPQETLRFEIQVPSPPKGYYILEFELVSENVCWFGLNGVSTIKVNVEVD